MSIGWFEKFMNFIGLSDNYEEEEEEELQPVEVRSRNKGAAVLSLHSAPEMKIIVVKPLTFEESEKLVGYLKNRKPVIVNFENAPKDVAQRIIDFLSGAILALNGSTLKVTAQTFLFVPSNVSVHSGEIPGDLRERIFHKLDQGGIRDR